MGEPTDQIGLMLNGLFRFYYLFSERSISIRNFCCEGMLLGSYATVIQGTPAHVNIEALEESDVATLSYEQFKVLFERHPSWEKLGRLIAESYSVE